MHFLLFYRDLVDDYVKQREAWRGQHLAHAKAAKARGELVLAGALDEPVDGAVLLFQGESAEVAKQFARHDPYVIHGLVGHWEVRPWITVIGDQATVQLG